MKQLHLILLTLSFSLTISAKDDHVARMRNDNFENGGEMGSFFLSFFLSFCSKSVKTNFKTHLKPFL